jgi:dipeptidyl aminopeptidase/acylaminoacyl peptidase
MEPAPRITAEAEQPLTIARAYLPVPGRGGQLYFASDMAGFSQVYRLAGADRFPVRLAPSQDRVLPVADTPQGLVVRRDRGGDELWQLGLIEDSGAFRPVSTDPRAIHREPKLSPDGRLVGLAYNPDGQSDWVLAVLDLETGRMEHRLDSGGYWTWLAWAPDASSRGDQEDRAVVAQLHSPLRSKAFLLSSSGELEPLLGHSRQVAGARWIDGRLLVLSDAERDFVGLVEVDPQDPGRVSRRLVDEDHDVEAVVPDPAGSRLAVVVNEGAFDSIRVLSSRTGQEEWRAHLPDGVVYSDNTTGVAQHLAWSPDGERLFVAWDSPTAPAEIFELPSNTCWTRASGDPIAGLVAPHQVSYRSFDGLEVPALHFPARRRAGAAGTTVVLFHGGPEGQTRGSFNPIVAMWNAAGFDVLAPNVRGSTGYGAHYDSLDDRELRWDSVRDGCEAGRWLRSTGQAARLVAMGGSYGGFMTLAVLVEDPSLWDAAVDVVGIADWHSFFRNTSGWRRSLRTAEYGEPAGPDGEFLAEFSPLRRAHSIRAHLLVIHGRNDVRVPVSEATQISDAVPGSELMIFDDEGHGIVRHGNRVRAYGRVLAFVRERLAGP